MKEQVLYDAQLGINKLKKNLISIFLGKCLGWFIISAVIIFVSMTSVMSILLMLLAIMYLWKLL